MDKQEALKKIEELKKYVEELDKQPQIEFWNTANWIDNDKEGVKVTKELLEYTGTNQSFAECNSSEILYTLVKDLDKDKYKYYIPLTTGYSFVRRIRR